MANVTTRTESRSRVRIPVRRLGWLLAIVVIGVSLSIRASDASAEIATFGSPLSVPAMLNTSENLSYTGVDTPLPGAIVHTSHYGADTALWNTTLASGSPTASAAGQVVKIALEGCAQQAAGGPSPLRQIHFQIYSPQSGGGAKVELTSQPFEIPVCGQSGASGSTISTYEPVNLCINAGGYVGFNDEGGYEEAHYRSGVPYQVIGAVQGSVADSFIKGGGTDNGATFSPSETSAMEGFATNHNEELMLQATLGTGPDARYVCPGGTKEAPGSGSSPSGHSKTEPSTPVSMGGQTDGVNHSRIVRVALYCRLRSACSGLAKLTSGHASYGNDHFSIPGRKTSLVAIRVPEHVIALLRKHRSGVPATLSVVISGKTFSQAIRLAL